METHSILTVPHFVTAKSPEQLKKKMMMLQVRLNTKLHFFDISPWQDGLIAWYEYKKDETRVNNGD